MYRTAALLSVVVCLAACASNDDKEADFVISTPLALDPTDEYELASWWSNGNELLFLGESGYYAIYGTGNRHRPPTERGKWWKNSYAALWLEPYETVRHENRRVSITRPADTLILTVPKIAPLMPLKGPPEVVEDRLMGRWNGDPGWLELREDMRYVFEPREVFPAHQPATLTRHQGSWAIEGELLRLRPDSPRAVPLVLELRETGDTIVLDSGDGELSRIIAGS